MVHFFSCSLHNHEQPKWDLIPLKLVWLPAISGLQSFLAQASSERNKTGLGLGSAPKWYSHICMALPPTQLAMVLKLGVRQTTKMTNIWPQYLFLASPKAGLVPRACSGTFPPTGFQQWHFGCEFGEPGLWVFLSFLCKGWPHSVCLHSYLGLLIKSYSQLSWLLVDYFFPLSMSWLPQLNLAVLTITVRFKRRNRLHWKQSSTPICENRSNVIPTADFLISLSHFWKINLNNSFLYISTAPSTPRKREGMAK